MNIISNSHYGPLLVNYNDTVIGAEVVKTGYWAHNDILLIVEILRFIKTQKNRKLVFFDVGANIGTHSLAIAKTFGLDVTIRAFEAQRILFYMMCGTMALNNLEQVYCYHKAVSEVGNEVIEFDLPDYKNKNNFGGLELVRPLRSDNSEMIFSQREKVISINLDSFDDKVDFIKIDVEGMEDKVLLGSKRIIAEHRPVMFLEILKTNTDKVLGQLSESNYLAFRRNADLVAIPAELNIQINDSVRIL